MGAYGCQVAPVSADAMRRLRSACAKLLDGAAASNRSVGLAFAAAGREVDPDVHVLFARAAAIRRQWWRHEQIRHILQAALDMH
eukprot:15463249-Alexandrium_andersonii.AAC.1